MKKVISYILSIIMIFSLMNTSVVYAEDINYKTATQDMFSSLSVYNGYLRINKYDSDYENLYIPKTMEYNSKTYPVMLNSEVFINNTIIKNIMLADGIALSGINARLFYGAKNLVSAKIENDGKFSNPETKTGSCSDFYGCSSLKECYDLSQYSACNKVLLNDINSIEEINSLPQNAISYTIRSTSLKSICDIPETAEEIELITPNIKNDIYILSCNVSDFIFREVTSSGYINNINLTIYAPEKSTTLDTLLKFQANHHNISVSALDNGKITGYQNIYCIGDSLTAGGYYTKSLQELVDTNKIIHKYGAEFDCTINGIYRTGTEKITLEDDVLVPYSKTKVKVKLSNNFCQQKAKVSQDSAGVNCCTIGGIEGFLSYENNSYYFIRANEGRVTEIKAGTPIETEFSLNYKKGDTLVLYFGTNDFNSGNYTNTKAVNEYANKLQSIIDYCQCKNYIVVGIAFGGGITDITTTSNNMKTYDNIMNNHFAGHYLNLREYFVANCQSICNDIELSSDDLDLLNKGIVPSVYYFDKTTHWEAETGGKVVAQAIYDKLAELGYEETVVPPACTSDGYTIHKCKLCDDEFATNYIQKTGHTYDNGKVTKSATCTANGVKTYTCTECNDVKTESIKALGHKYTAKVVKPTYTSEGYTLHTCTRCKKSYKDKKTKKLVLKNTSISKLTAGKKAFTLKWKKSTFATGYQIQYATDSKFTKNKKTVTISKNKTTSKKVTKLKAKKKYYVRIRTYKTVSGKKVYSSWSKAKTVKTK